MSSNTELFAHANGFDGPSFAPEGPFSPDLLPDFDGSGVMAPPPLSPLRIDHFRFASDTTLESRNVLTWVGPQVDGLIKIYRKTTRLVTQSNMMGFQALTVPEAAESAPGDWVLIGVEPVAGPSAFYDDDIPAVNTSLPKASRRSLGQVYSYKLEVSAHERPRNGRIITTREARSPAIHTRIRGINAPEVEPPESISDTEILVTWNDMSDLASGFEVHYHEEGVGTEQMVTLNGTSRNSLVIQGLTPDTEYWVGVRAFDYYGKSYTRVRGARTERSPVAEPEDRTYNLSLTRQNIYQGFVPYLGRFPTAGLLPAGTLRQVSLAVGWPALSFPKVGKSTADCDNPDDVVVLAPGQSMTHEQMAQVFGASTPELPVMFLACAQATAALLNWIPINVTYRAE